MVADDPVPVHAVNPTTRGPSSSDKNTHTPSQPGPGTRATMNSLAFI
jgi:hypothetical protein